MNSARKGKGDVTAIILAGGKSIRMKQDKGLAYLNNRRMIEYVLDAVGKVTDTIMIISNNPAYNQFGYAVYPDLIADCGPMGGIFTGLSHSVTRKNIVLSCDIPFVSEAGLSLLVQYGNTEDALVFEHDGNTEPLCGLYDTRCKDIFRELIEQKELKMMKALQKLDTVKINFADSGISLNDIFVNLNTPEELESFQLEKK